jgi:hypothetical protein
MAGASNPADSTFFMDEPVPFTSTPGTVTVTAEETNAVPAPTGLVLAGIGGLTSLLACWKSRRKAWSASRA